MSPAPSPTHQDAVGELFVALRAYAAEHGGKAFVSPIDVVFSNIDAVQPDVVYIAPSRMSIVGEQNLQGAPTLVVEVLSPSSSTVDLTVNSNVRSLRRARVLDRRSCDAHYHGTRRARG